MRLSVMIYPLLVFAWSASTAARPADDNRVRCPTPATATEKAVFKRLGELPPAEAFRAVLRSSDCPARAIQARDRLGVFPKPSR